MNYDSWSRLRTKGLVYLEATPLENFDENRLVAHILPSDACDWAS